MVRRSRFAPPRPTNRAARPLRTEIIEPVKGLNTAVPPQNLQPGETPESQNFYVDDRTLRPRSGLSQYGASGFGTEKPLGAVRFDDVLGTTYDVIISDQTSSVRSEGAAAWSTLASTPDSSATTAYYDTAVGYAPSLDENVVIIANGVDAPKYFTPIASGWAAVGDFDSHESFAKYATFYDDRAVFFNVGSRTTLPYATRVRWSQRGNPLEFTDKDAGFQDLVDMRGEGTGIFSEEDHMVLFTEEETWMARSRRDQYVFEFFPLSREVGNPHPRSAAVTDKGIIWLDKEFRFRLVTGNQVLSFNDNTQRYLKDNLKEVTEVWSTFDQAEGRYEFNFSDTTGEYPTRALWLKTATIAADPLNPNLLTGTWMHQNYGAIEASAGVQELRVSSVGTALRLRSEQTNDIGTDIDARWRSHAFRFKGEADIKEQINGSWLDYEADAASNVSLLWSTDLGGNFTDAGRTFSITNATDTARLALATKASRYQQVELRLDDGGSPRIVNLRLDLRQYTGRF